VIDLEAALFNLAEELDHPAGNDLDEMVRRRLSGRAPVAAYRRPRGRALLAIAAAIVVITAAVVAVGPARHAIADWLGIGAVEVQHSDRLVPPATGPNTVPGASATDTTAPESSAAKTLATARTEVDFPIVTPRSPLAGALAGVEVDARPPGGLVVLRYPRFTLIEVASRAGSGPILRKIVGPARVDDVTVAGVPGMWIAGAHEIGYVDRNGALRTDTVRRSGPVLLFERGDVTYRIEGLNRLADAEEIARSLH